MRAMIIHDEHCNEHHIDHTPGHQANPKAWRLGRNEFVQVPYNHPITGWRYVEVAHYRGEVLSFDRFSGHHPTAWDNTIGAPEAQCIPRLRRAASRRHPWNIPAPHEVCDPICTCGYRVVHDAVDLIPYVKALADFRSTQAATDLPDEVRTGGNLPPTADVNRSVVIVSIKAAGNAARSEFNQHHDPDQTLRTQWVAATPTVITTQDDPVNDALTHFGSNPTPVPDIRGVHEPDRCGDEQRTWANMTGYASPNKVYSNTTGTQ